MPISPYYKRLWTEDLNQQPPPYSLGTTPTQRPEQSLDLGVNRDSLFDPEAMPPQPTPRYSLGITPSMPNQRNNLGLTYNGPNLGVQLPDPFAPMPEEPAKLPNPNIARSRALRLPQPGDINDNSLELSPWAPRLIDDDTLIKQPPRYSLGMTKTRFPYNLGVDLYKQDEEQPEPQQQMPEGTPMPQQPAVPRLSELDISQEALSDPQRRRGLYTALAQFTAGMGNIAGKPTDTTVPQYFQDLTTQEGQQQENLFKRAQAQRQAVEAQYRIQQQQYEAELRNRMKDPNSRESMVAREAINRYATKFGLQPVPDTATAEDLERQMPILRDVIRAESQKMTAMDEMRMRETLAADADARKYAMDSQKQERALSQQLLLKDKEIKAQEEANRLNRLGRIEEARVRAQEAEQARAAQREFTASQANIGRQFQASQANQAREFQRGMKEVEIGARRQEIEEKRAEESKELVVPGYKLTGQVKPTSAEAQAARKGVAERQSFHRNIKKMIDLINKYGPSELGTTEGGALMESTVGALKMNVKTLYDLGQIQGADVGLIMEQIPDPTKVGWLGIEKLMNEVTGKKNLIAKLKNSAQTLSDKTEDKLRSMGYEKEGTVTPQGTQPPASPSGRRVVRP